jgi:polar amino acid transport system substrate-binding protein
MAERAQASCAVCAYDAAPAERLPGARRALGKAMACAALAGVLWATAPAWTIHLPHLPEHLPVEWQLAMAGNSLITAQTAAKPSPAALGPVLHAARARGELVVAVRHYRRPALAGAQAPLEPDRFDTEMAAFLSTRLGLPLRLVMAGPADATADLVIAGSSAATGGHAGRVPTAYTGGTGALVVLRGSSLARAADLRGQRVCVAAGSPYARGLAERHGAVVRYYAAAVQAVAGFMAGECQALADDELTVARLMQAPEWRFYRQLDVRLQPDNRTPQIALRTGDAQSIAWLDRAVRQWKSGGALIEARQHRAADVGFEAIQLQDGLVCHS